MSVRVRFGGNWRTQTPNLTSNPHFLEPEPQGISEHGNKCTLNHRGLCPCSTSGILRSLGGNFLMVEILAMHFNKLQNPQPPHDACCTS